jgi:hypothetical protein
MKSLSKITTRLLGREFILLPVFTLLSMAVLLPVLWADRGVESTPLPSTLFYRSESDLPLQAPLKTPQTFSDSQVLPAQVSIFYPTRGQFGGGFCWMGLRIDGNDNIYPINPSNINPDGNEFPGGFYKILSDGTLVNGVNDQNLFAFGGLSYWGELDEHGGKLYTSVAHDVRSAPFIEGSTFSSLISGLNDGDVIGGNAIALGQGPLAESLFVSEREGGQIGRVMLSPLGLSVFASGPSPSFTPEAIASAPDGSLYVANQRTDPATLMKITPAGVLSTFQTGTIFQVNRAVAVDKAGNIYWSHAAGINKYDASGNFLWTLPGPPDKPAYGNPMGAAFDSSGNLYIVDNFDCKKIYKYTIGVLQVIIDLKPGESPNSINPRSQGVIPVAILTTDTFDATAVDPSTVLFGATGTEATPVHAALEDVNSDGRTDMILHFNTQDTGIQCGDTSASLTGETFSGQAIQGSDAIQTVGCKM